MRHKNNHITSIGAQPGGRCDIQTSLISQTNITKRNNSSGEMY